MDLATVGVVVGFAGVGWALGNYDGDPDPRGWDGLVTFGPTVLLAAVGFVLFIVESQRSDPEFSLVETWIVAMIGAGIGFVVGRVLGPVLKGRR